MAPTSTVLMASRSADSNCLHVVGRGTMAESATAMAFVTSSLDGPGTAAVVDLSRCDYLDSTFLGCLVRLHGRFNAGGSRRLAFVADAAKAGQLLGPSRLDRVLPLAAELPGVFGSPAPLPCDGSADAATLARHVMDSHRELAEVDGPDRAKFSAIADRMAAELGEGV